MNKKYIKNRYQIVSFLLSMTTFIFVSIIVFVVTKNKTLSLFIAIIPVAVIFLCSTLGFYYVFQIVSFDEIGIHVHLLGKEIRSISWWDVVDIQESYIYRGPVYSIKCSNGFILNLDRRKKIKEEIDKYVNSTKSI